MSFPFLLCINIRFLPFALKKGILLLLKLYLLGSHISHHIFYFFFGLELAFRKSYFGMDSCHILEFMIFIEHLMSVGTPTFGKIKDRSSTLGKMGYI